ncbi:GNAT family N-acetyltransferase [Candidatus Saccharibacteria bacterium]|nr:GNAT family N-acetyltransferase [Candidatus Saccharibacteria bacterium]
MTIENNPRINIDQEPYVAVRHLIADDIDSLSSIMEQWVRNPETGEVIDEEIGSIKQLMVDSLLGGNIDRQYLVAEDASGEPIGVMGMAYPSDDMLTFTSTERPIEIVNAFVDGDSRGMGVGSQLLDSVFAIAKGLGATEVIVNSGPRYKESAWDFYDKKFGGRITILKDKYGPGLDAPVWEKIL